jgi:hypothetical protein
VQPSGAKQLQNQSLGSWILISIFAPFIGAVGGSSTSSLSEQSYNFNYQASAYYPIHVVSYRL